MISLINEAYAATPTATAGASESMFSFVMLGAIFVLFYFMLIRPQSKRAKEHKEVISKLKKGDEVITSAGMLGKIVEINEQFAKISIAEGVEVTIQKQAINTVMPKGTIKSL